MSGELAFPWEREAMRGEEMPEGLSFPDQLAYTTLRNVYHAYYNKIITREAAAAEKGRLKYVYERAVRQMKFEKMLSAHQARLWVELEGPAGDFAKARKAGKTQEALEAADRMWQVLYRMPPPKKEENEHGFD